MFDKNIKAKLVFDGKNLSIPTDMGSPREDQMQGTIAERLCEGAGRICYDSLGTGRNSGEYHIHLLDVKHWSVYEHPHFTVKLSPEAVSYDLLMNLMNRPGLSFGYSSAQCPRVTFNPRVLLDWNRWTQYSYCADRHTSLTLRDSLLEAVRPAAPQLFQRLESLSQTGIGCQLEEPLLPSEQYITLYLSGSRGMSHEQVRHRFNISQRSTRYVDEDGSPWVVHPLTTLYLEKTGDNNLLELKNGARNTCNNVYASEVSKLQAWLIAQGVDKFTARKQARGAARGWLGNALCTEMFFTANVLMWRDMLRLRGNQAADAEIRVMYSQVLSALKASQYGNQFMQFELEPSPDGIGDLCVEKK